MNILLINHYAGSPVHGMEYRPYYLAKEWSLQGHKVRIVAASFSHVRAIQPTSPAETRFWEQVIDGVEYWWIHSSKYHRNGIGRLRNILTFLLGLWRLAPQLSERFRPDLVIASSTYPLDIWLAHRIARRARARLVFEVHDLWPLSLIEISGMSKYHPFVVLCQLAQRFALSRADTVISMLPHVHNHMQNHGLDLRRLHIVPNGVDLREWDTPRSKLTDELTAYLDEQRKQHKTIVGYLGSHGVPNALPTLLHAAKRLDAARFSVVLVGDGLEKSALRQLCAELEIKNVAFFDPIKKSLVPTFLSQIDIAYIGWRNLGIYRFGIAPNKLMDYMVAGCVILHSVNAANNLVDEVGCGYTVAAEDAGAVADGIRRLADIPGEVREAMGQSGRMYVREHCTYPVLAQRFLDACQT